MLGGRPFKPEEAFHLAAVQLDIRGVQERAQWSGVLPRREVSVTICARDDDFEAASSDLGHMPDYVIKIGEWPPGILDGPRGELPRAGRDSICSRPAARKLIDAGVALRP
jgi:hypothetical protein